MSQRHLPTQDVLLRLIADALSVFYSCAEGFQGRATRGASMALSGEPVADLNYLLVNRATQSSASAFREYVGICDEADIPFAAMLAPDAAGGLKHVCEELKLVYATEWPLMVCDADVIRDYPASGVEVRRMVGEADLIAMSEILASAFHMPDESVRRAMPLHLTESPSIDIFLAERYGAAQSTVTVTYHGDIAGIWAMGTLGIAQGEGVGKALLSRVMVACRDAGIKAFFLGATPSGFPLYEKLGYRTLFNCDVWVRGETHQA